jgi:hypothetical protein
MYVQLMKLNDPRKYTYELCVLDYADLDCRAIGKKNLNTCVDSALTI